MEKLLFKEQKRKISILRDFLFLPWFPHRSKACPDLDCHSSKLTTVHELVINPPLDLWTFGAPLRKGSGRQESSPQFITAITQWGKIPYTGRSRLVCAITMSTFSYPEPPGEDLTVSWCHLATCGCFAEAANLMPMLFSSDWKLWKHLRGCV